MSTPVPRHATRSDAKAMADILNPIIRAGGTTAFEAEFSAAGLADLIFGAGQLVSCFVTEDDLGLSGFQYVTADPSRETGTGYIATFARMSPKHAGVGRALFAATLQAAQEAGLLRIDAKIRADNTGGLAFYAKMGFQDHSVIPGVPLLDGTPVDRIVKRLDV